MKEYFEKLKKRAGVNQRKDAMIKWLHSAYLTGYNTGRCSND